MNAAAWLRVVRVEVQKLLSRASARFGLVVAIGLALLMPSLLAMVDGSVYAVGTTEQVVSADLAKALRWTLYGRNFFVLRAFVVLYAALIFAAEFQARTLREDLLRPVGRVGVLMAKWVALSTWIVLATTLTWLVAVVLGGIAFGVDAEPGAWQDLAKSWAATVACDVGFAALALCASVWLRSVASTVMGVFLFLVLDTFMGWGLSLLAMAAEWVDVGWMGELAIQARPWLPSSAFGLWAGWFGGEPPVWQHFAALVLITALALALAAVRFQRLDVP